MRRLDPYLVEREDACDFAGLKRTAFFAACRDGELERVKQGRKTLVTMESLRRYVEKLTAASRASSNQYTAVSSMPSDAGEPQSKSPPAPTRKPRVAKRVTAQGPCKPLESGEALPQVMDDARSAGELATGDYDEAWLILAGAVEPNAAAEAGLMMREARLGGICPTFPTLPTNSGQQTADERRLQDVPAI